MAARQDQGLQIGLIFAVSFAVLLAVTTYLGFKSASDWKQQSAVLEEEKKSEYNAKINLQSENESYREMMGFQPLEARQDVQATFEEDMKRFGGTFDESRRNYREILEYVFEENDKITQRETSAKDQLKELTERLQAVESAKEAQVETFRLAMQKAAEDAAQQRTKFAADRQRLEATKQELVEELDRRRTKLQGEIDQLQAQVAELEGKLENIGRVRDRLVEERKVETTSFEVADGRVTLVNQNGTVWVNVGAADAVRPQVTFSVYDADLHDAAKAEKKGSIEVTRVLDDHVAEARITNDDPRNPILVGDQIYSQVWHRGKQLRFALTGFIDIDGDSRSDLKLARDLIRLNGAIVDAYVDENGEIKGEMTLETRYLVLGERPTEAMKTAISQAYDRMGDVAAEIGIEPIGLDEFLNRMGYVPQERTVALGRGASSRDFPPLPKTSNPSDTVKRAVAPFPRRSPYIRSENQPPY